MPAYGKVKVDTITYDLSGTATDVSVADIATKASPTFTGTINAANLILSGDLTVNGTTTTIDTTTLQVEDKNIEIGKVSSPSDTTADGGGWTLKGSSDKTFNWVNATDAWTSSEHIHLGDNKKLLMGTGSDLQIYHDGSASRIVDSGTGGISIQGSNVNIFNPAADASMITCATGGAVELYNTGNKKLETTTNGIQVTGRLRFDSDNYIDCNNTADTLEVFLGGGQVGEFGTGFLKLLDDKTLQIGTGSDLQIWHDGSNSFLLNNTGNLYIQGDSSSTTEEILIRPKQGEQSARFIANGAVELYHDNSKKLETTSSGINVTGAINVNGSPLAGGNTVELVADGAIAAGKPVIITSAGKARQVQEESQPVDRVVRNSGSESAQSSHGGTDDHYLERSKKNCVAYNSGNDTCFVLLRTSGHSSSNNQVVGYVYASDSSNADNLTIEKIEAITAANQANDGRICVCALSSNRYFVAYYRSDTDAGVRCKIITVGSNGSTWSAGSEYHIGGTSGASNVDYMTAVETTTNRVCILARSNDDSRPTLIVGDITSNNVWNDRRNELISTNSIDNPYENEMYYDSTDDVLCAIYQTAGANIRLVAMRVAAGTGAALTVGTIQTLNSATSDKNSIAFHSASGNWVTAYRNNTGNKDSHYQVHSVNSSTLAITSGTAITRSSANAQYGIALSVTAENRVFVTYVASNQTIQGEVFTVSGTSITSQGAPNGLLSSYQDFDRHGSVYMSHNSRLAIFGTRGSNGLYYGTGDTTSIQSNINTIGNNILGFAPSAINDTATGTINLPGNTVDNQSSLTAGTRYYIQDNGTLGTTFVTTRGGILALSATKGVVYGHDS